MSRVRLFWAILAVVGAIVPLAQFIGWFAVTGGTLPGMFGAWFDNGAVAGLAWDMMISSTVVSVFIIHESLVKRDYWPLVCLAVIPAIGLSCALPLYLFLRSRPVD